ncbi:MAG: hypothetical protein V3S51_08490 [Dehalococcoidia bacterium]
MGVLETQKQREARRDQGLQREMNALSIMPLPLKIPAEWYDLLPRLLPLVSRSPEESRYYIAEKTVQAFLQLWEQRLMKRDGDDVWVRLGGLECYESIPKFAEGVDYRIKGRDEEIKAEGGIKAVIEYWRANVEDLRDLDDQAVFKARMKILPAIDYVLSAVALSGAWGVAFQRSKDNIIKIREEVQRWIADNGSQWDLDKPFGGKISESCDPYR